MMALFMKDRHHIRILNKNSHSCSISNLFRVRLGVTYYKMYRLRYPLVFLLIRIEQPCPSEPEVEGTYF